MIQCDFYTKQSTLEIDDFPEFSKNPIFHDSGSAPAPPHGIRSSFAVRSSRRAARPPGAARAAPDARIHHSTCPVSSAITGSVLWAWGMAPVAPLGPGGDVQNATKCHKNLNRMTNVSSHQKNTKLYDNLQLICTQSWKYVTFLGHFAWGHLGGSRVAQAVPYRSSMFLR